MEPFTVPAYSPPPPEEVRHAVCAMFTEDTASFMQHVTGGPIHLQPRALLTRWFDCLSECGDPSCGCNRIKLPHVRADFCKRVCEVTAEALEQLDSSIIHLITLGGGNLLTEFEILCRFATESARPLQIGSVSAIDICYATDSKPAARNSVSQGHSGALRQLSSFIGPSPVYAFPSVDDYVAAVAAAQVSMSNVLLFCDAGAVPEKLFTDVAAAALVEGGCAFQLSNRGSVSMGGRNGFSVPLERILPLELQKPLPGPKTYSYRQTSTESVAESKSHRSLHSSGDSPCQLVPINIPSGSRTQVEKWLVSTQQQRAKEHGRRMFSVVASGRVAVRCTGCHSARSMGYRLLGNLVIAQQVKADGWVRLSLLDTYWGYLAQPWPIKREQAWICLTDTAGLEQLREVDGGPPLTTRCECYFCCDEREIDDVDDLSYFLGFDDDDQEGVSEPDLSHASHNSVTLVASACNVDPEAAVVAGVEVGDQGEAAVCMPMVDARAVPQESLVERKSPMQIRLDNKRTLEWKNQLIRDLESEH